MNSFRGGVATAAALAVAVAAWSVVGSGPEDARAMPSAPAGASVSSLASRPGDEHLAVPGGQPPATVATSAEAGPPGRQEGLQQRLRARFERLSARGDFGMAPRRMLAGLLARGCPAAPPPASGGDSPGEDEARCRALLFSILREREGFPRELTEADLWEVLTHIDAAAGAQLFTPSAQASIEAFAAAYERFREERRRLAGDALEHALFGLSDELMRLPTQVAALAREDATPLPQRLEAFRQHLTDIEASYGVELARVMEPVELARLELRLRESSGAVDAAAQRGVLEHYLGPERAREYLAAREAQQSLHERLEAFNRELFQKHSLQ